MALYYLPAPRAVYPPIPPIPPRAYLCPYCGTSLYWLTTGKWYCPYHGEISKWKYRFL